MGAIFYTRTLPAPRSQTPHPDNYETARQMIGIGGLGGPTISGPKGKCPGGPGPARENQPGPWWGQIIPGWGMPGEALGPVGSGAPIPTRRRQECRRNTFYTPYRGSGFWDRARAHSKELRATQKGPGKFAGRTSSRPVFLEFAGRAPQLERFILRVRSSRGQKISN